ncbi:MAG: hypothetical protein FWJ61_01785 [Limnochordales bacterium]
MKRFSLVFAMALVLAVSAMALAASPGAPLPEGAREAETFELQADGSWARAMNARSFNSGSAAGHCNRECWNFELVNHVSVAQWINFSVDGTRKDWQVLKPGTYASDSVSARISSNNDVRITFWAEDPQYEDSEVESPPIAKWFGYGIGDESANGPGMVEQWVRASDYGPDNPLVFTIRYEDGLADGLLYRIWEKIEVTSQHRSSDYHGTGAVEICVTNLKWWVDPDNGGFVSLDEDENGNGNGNG